MRRYAIKEMFWSVQGEGTNAGMPAMFVRFAGCNLWSGNPMRRHGEAECADWCDTDFVGGARLLASDLVAEMRCRLPRGFNHPICVLTGGEPLLQVDTALVVALKEAGWRVAIETNGTIDSEALQHAHWICVSPKLGADLRVRRASELKVVVPGSLRDGVGWTHEALLELADSGLWVSKFVQPMDPVRASSSVDAVVHATESAYAWCFDFVTQHPGWRISMQMHKALGVR